jgi:2-polyprenyl-3-methyl-5-hydroxy-6-metoxy-1,4-benzoquinol methylase
MIIRQDPEENEIRSLIRLVDLSGRDVLEIGCGDGRLTWRYALQAASVVAIDSFCPSIRQARVDMPGAFQDRVELRQVGFLDFASACASETYDIALLSWSL